MAVFLGAEIVSSEIAKVFLAQFGFDIGLDAVLVDIRAFGSQIFGNGHGETGPISKPTNSLNQALAEGFLAHQLGTSIVLQCAGKNFTGTR